MSSKSSKSNKSSKSSKSSSKIYCGANKLPKNKKLGSMKDCAQAGQIRLYGVKKVDPITLKATDKTISLKVQYKNTRAKLVQSRGLKMIMKKKFDREKVKTDRNMPLLQSMIAKMKKLDKTIDDLGDKLDELDKKINTSKLERSKNSRSSRNSRNSRKSK
jgi:hypothetical protein